MGFQVIDDLKKADELAKAGLVWYDLNPIGEQDYPRPWSATRGAPSSYAETSPHLGFEFYILLEE